MSYFLKRVVNSKRRLLDRAVAIAAAGASVTARVPFPLQNSQVLHDLLPRHLPYFNQAGILGLSSYRVSPVPSSDISKETSGALGSKSNYYFGRHTIANAAAKVGPAVVNIAVSQGLRIGSGSGTIINKDGIILTRAHVVFDHAVLDFQCTISLSEAEVEVTLQDGRTFEGKVVNADMHSDIAIVKINSETPLPEAKLGSSSTLRLGDLVIAMGCPHSFQNTVTAGIVSCVSGTPREYLQTDCAVYEGYSGGPLVNMDGEVIGVNIIKVKQQVSTDDDDGLSFSVPIDSVSKIVEHFKKSGRVVRPWLGLELFDLNEMIIAQLKKEDASFPNVDKGILVPMVMPGSPGDRAGFRPDDVVVEFDGKPVESINEVIEIMWDKVGVPIKVLVKRASDKLVTLTVIPEEESDLDV